MGLTPLCVQGDDALGYLCFGPHQCGERSFRDFVASLLGRHVRLFLSGRLVLKIL